jgi:hypothetical protein
MPSASCFSIPLVWLANRLPNPYSSAEYELWVAGKTT